MLEAWLQRLVALRGELSLCAEPAGQEARTAALIAAFFRSHGLGQVQSAGSGNGLLIRVGGSAADPSACRVVLRCELDALAIPDVREVSGRTIELAHSHRCGHDGHMAIVAGAGVRFFFDPVEGVDLYLLFQPSEETGTGAREVLSGGELASLAPRLIMGIHNLPGLPLGEVVLRPGVFASASCGWSARLTGRTAHAAQPEEGLPPTGAVTALAAYLESMPQRQSALEEPLKVTVIHLRVGQPAFGTSPGEGVVMATFRAWSDGVLTKAMARADDFAKHLARAWGLTCEVARHEDFPATVNDPGFTRLLGDCLARSGRPHIVREFPFPWSEDFGNYASVAPLLFFGLGSGIDCPALHHPDYVFPDALIPEGAEIIHTFLKDCFQKGGGCP